MLPRRLVISLIPAVVVLLILVMLPLVGLAAPGGGEGSGAIEKPPSMFSGTTKAADASISKIVTAVNGQPASGNGHGTNAVPVHQGDQVTYQITVTGQPPGNSNKGTVTDNFPQHSSFVSAVPSTFVQDGSHTKGSWNNVDFTANGGVNTFTITLAINSDAPCNSVLTNVGHVDGLGSDQAQVEVICGASGATTTPTATNTPTSSGATSTPTATSTSTVTPTTTPTNTPGGLVPVPPAATNTPTRTPTAGSSAPGVSPANTATPTNTPASGAPVSPTGPTATSTPTGGTSVSPSAPTATNTATKGGPPTGGGAGPQTGTSAATTTSSAPQAPSGGTAAPGSVVAGAAVSRLPSSGGAPAAILAVIGGSFLGLGLLARRRTKR